MKTSMWTSYLMELAPEEMVGAFAARGWKSLELSDEHGLELLRRGDIARTAAAFRKVADDAGVSLAQGHLFLKADIVHPDAAERRKTLDDLKRWLELFVGVGVKSAVLHPGGYAAAKDGWGKTKIHETRTAGLKELADTLKGADTAICVENIYHSSADELVEAVDAVGGANLALCLDTGHLHFSGGKQSEFIRKAGKRLKALHIADNLGVNDDHMLPYGAGTVDWAAVMGALREIKYDRLFNFEVPGERRCPMPVRLAKLDYALRLGDCMVSDAMGTAR